MLAMWPDPIQGGTCPTRQGPLRRWKGHNAPRCTVCPSKKNSLQSSAARSVQDVATLGTREVAGRNPGSTTPWISLLQADLRIGLPSGWARTQLCFWELENDNQQVDNLGVCQCFKFFVVFFFFSGDPTSGFGFLLVPNQVAKRLLAGESWAAIQDGIGSHRGLKAASLESNNL